MEVSLSNLIFSHFLIIRLCFILVLDEFTQGNFQVVWSRQNPQCTYGSINANNGQFTPNAASPIPEGQNIIVTNGFGPRIICEVPV